MKARIQNSESKILLFLAKNWLLKICLSDINLIFYYVLDVVWWRYIAQRCAMIYYMHCNINCKRTTYQTLFNDPFVWHQAQILAKNSILQENRLKQHYLTVLSTFCLFKSIQISFKIFFWDLRIIILKFGAKKTINEQFMKVRIQNPELKILLFSARKNMQKKFSLSKSLNFLLCSRCFKIMLYSSKDAPSSFVFNKVAMIYVWHTKHFLLYNIPT